MIGTITSNPSLDRIPSVSELAPGVPGTVGAGDSLRASFVRSGGSGPEARRVGIVWAAAAVQTPGTGVPAARLGNTDVVEVSAIAVQNR